MPILEAMIVFLRQHATGSAQSIHHSDVLVRQKGKVVFIVDLSFPAVHANLCKVM